MTTTPSVESRIEPSFALFWLALLLIAVAEFLTAVVQPHIGMLFHMLLIGAMIYTSVAPRELGRRLALALMLLPIIRLLSLALPLGYLPRMAWYPAVAVPLLVAIWGVVRQNKISRQDLGLRLETAPLQLALIIGGLGIGAIKYLILQPAPQTEAFSWSVFLMSSINLLMFTGFTEELLFRTAPAAGGAGAGPLGVGVYLVALWRDAHRLSFGHRCALSCGGRLVVRTPWPPERFDCWGRAGPRHEQYHAVSDHAHGCSSGARIDRAIRYSARAGRRHSTASRSIASPNQRCAMHPLRALRLERPFKLSDLTQRTGIAVRRSGS